MPQIMAYFELTQKQKQATKYMSQHFNMQALISAKEKPTAIISDFNGTLHEGDVSAELDTFLSEPPNMFHKEMRLYVTSANPREHIEDKHLKCLSATFQKEGDWYLPRNPQAYENLSQQADIACVIDDTLGNLETKMYESFLGVSREYMINPNDNPDFKDMLQAYNAADDNVRKQMVFLAYGDWLIDHNHPAPL